MSDAVAPIRIAECNDGVEILDETRTNTYVRFIARTLDIQPKDVSILILVLAAKHSEREPAILTNDEAFAACVPETHNHPSIIIEYVA